MAIISFLLIFVLTLFNGNLRYTLYIEQDFLLGFYGRLVNFYFRKVYIKREGFYANIRLPLMLQLQSPDVAKGMNKTYRHSI